MKALLYSAVRTASYVELPDPVPGPGEVRVRVAGTGICGSDVHGFLGLQARRQPGLVLGHETVGTIDQVGDGVDAGRVGARVAVNPLVSCRICPNCLKGRHSVCRDWHLIGLDRVPGAMAEWFVIPERNVHSLPAHVGDGAAVMIEPLANAVHLLSHVPEHAGAFPSIAIFGGGTFGAATLAVAKARGWNVVAVVEPNPGRAAAMRALGAPRTIDPRTEDTTALLRAWTDGVGPEVVADCVGRAATRRAAADAVARGGTVLLLGLDEGATELDFIDLVRREIRLQCSYTYREADFADALAMVVAGACDFGPWIDHVPLAEGQQAFDRLCTDPGDRLKIVLVP
ncbi:MAG: zinc-binding dehydrogenase [Armatimonadota bacterium]